MRALRGLSVAPLKAGLPVSVGKASTRAPHMLTRALLKAGLPVVAAASDEEPFMF